MSKITIPGNSILLLEGGSLRGLYTAGVLDSFMANAVFFAAAAGLSSGLLQAMNNVSRRVPYKHLRPPLKGVEQFVGDSCLLYKYDAADE